MIGLDTNILIRYFTRDDEEQCQQATELIQAGEKCFITNIVLCEMVWVLKGEPYKFSKGDILETIEAMLHSPTFEFENTSAVYQALQRTREGRADFSDYMIEAISRQYGCLQTASFDKKLRGEDGFRCL